MPRLIETYANTWMALALSNLNQEFPNASLIVAEGGDDRVLMPSTLHPAFYGSYDFHSAIEMQWLIVTLLREIPSIPLQTEARTLLSQRLNPTNIAHEVRFFETPPYRAWERPYGWGWLFQLADALASWDDPNGHAWLSALTPLITLFTERLIEWLTHAPYAIRHGLHNNSAFSLDLLWSWAHRMSPDLESEIIRAMNRWYLLDTQSTYGTEPSGTDFLSPALSEAALMTHYLCPDNFAIWLDHFLDSTQWRSLASTIPLPNPFDAHESHLYGLQLSRSYHLFTIAGHLWDTHPYREWILTRAQILLHEALPYSLGADYLLDHWIPAFALRAALAAESVVDLCP